jgi:hypothetical protein
MSIDEFIENLKQNCEPIVVISAKHILNKLNMENINKKQTEEIFSNYNNYIIYLNDIAGQIYRRHNSSAELIYRQLCKYLHIEWDNKSLYNSRLNKLNSIDTVSLDSLDDDIKVSIFDKLHQQNEVIKTSKYYINYIKDQTYEQQTKI